jgi:xanthine dehydrogenase YagS FAD-binding subunit
MNNFEYAIPDSLDKTFEYLRSSHTQVKAGGIDLLDLMKEDLAAPGRLVTIRDLVELKFLDMDKDGRMQIGPALTLSELAVHKKLKGAYRALAQAAAKAATPLIRNAASLGGNLCQRPRCWYFRSNDFNCTRKGGNICFALDGENQYHAIFGNSDGCAIVHPSATAVALMALDAQINISNGDDQKEIPIDEFFVTPAQDIQKENVLAANELITAVIIPSAMKNYISFYCKLKEKQSSDWPLADVAVALQMNGNVCKDARIVLGSAAPVPMRSKNAEAVLMNKKLDKLTATQASEAALENAEPLSLNAYKIPVFKTVIYRTICQAVGIDPLV